MAPKLYGSIVSPPVRAVLMCAKAIDLELDFVDIDLVKKDQNKPEFLKLNVLHTVPVLDDNGFILPDSHAIMVYLIESYAKDRSLYPVDVKEHARINQMLHFDSGTLFARYIVNSMPVLLDGVKVLPDENVAPNLEAYGFLETFLQGKKYVAGDKLSIADFSLVATLSNATAFVPLDEDKYPNIRSWKKTLKALPYYNINVVGSGEYHNLVKSIMSK